MQKLSFILYFVPFMVGAFNTTSFASTPSTALPQWRMGFGVATEYANYEANLKIEPLKKGYDSNISSAYQQIIKKLQFAPNFEFGATFKNNYYLGAQFSWRKVNAHNESKNDLRVGNYRFLNHFKLDSCSNLFIKPGYKFTPNVMVYGLVGVSIANWSHTTQLVSDDPISKTLEPSNTCIIKRRSMGVGLGLGMEYIIHEKYSLSFDYTSHFHRSKLQNHEIIYLTYYNKYNPKNNTNNLHANQNHVNITKKIQPSYSTFAVRLTYFVSLF